MLRSSALLFVFFFCGTVHAQFGNKKSRQKLTSIAQSELTDGAAILKRSGDFKYEKYLDGKTNFDVLQSLNTVVHESCHKVNGDLSRAASSTTRHEGYFISKDVQIFTKKGPTYNSIELNRFVPKKLQKEIFRYDTYVGAPKKVIWVGSQIDGIYGMLDEFCAYYHGTKASFELYDYYYKNVCDGYKKKEAWKDYIQEVSSTHYAYYEFKLFLSWYLQYAKKKHPDVYKSTMANKELRLAYTLIEQNYAQLISDYYARLDQLLADLSKDGSKVAVVEDEGKYWLRFYSKNNTGYSGYGVHESDVILLKALLEDEQHNILDDFRMEGVTMANYKDFLK